jgi:hypothetical protein
MNVMQLCIENLKYAWPRQLKVYADLDPTAKLLKTTEFPRMVKELIQNLNPQQHLPNVSEKSLLVPLNCQKVLERLLSIAKPQYISRNLDSVLLKGLEVKRFGQGTKKKPRGEKDLAVLSYSEDSDKESEEEEVDDEDSKGQEMIMAMVESEEEQVSRSFLTLTSVPTEWAAKLWSPMRGNGSESECVLGSEGSGQDV